MELKLARLDAGGVQQVAYQLTESVGVQLSNIQDLFLIFLRETRVAKQIQTAADGGEGGLQIVADHGEELGLEPVESPQLLVQDRKLRDLLPQLRLILKDNQPPLLRALTAKCAGPENEHPSTGCQAEVEWTPLTSQTGAQLIGGGGIEQARQFLADHLPLATG